jgi:carboxymethylenebutenolidase
MASCPDCVKGVQLDGEPTGSVFKFSDTGIDAYFAPGPQETASTRCVFLLTNIFGLPLKNSKILADSIAREFGCDVWVPDLFNGMCLVR